MSALAGEHGHASARRQGTEWIVPVSQAAGGTNSVSSPGCGLKSSVPAFAAAFAESTMADLAAILAWYAEQDMLEVGRLLVERSSTACRCSGIKPKQIPRGSA